MTLTPDVFEITVGDTSPNFEATLYTDRAKTTAANLTGATVVIWIRDIDGNLLVNDAAVTLVDAANGQIRYGWASGDTDTVGVHYGRIKVTYSDSSIGHFPNGHDITFVFDRGKT